MFFLLTLSSWLWTRWMYFFVFFFRVHLGWLWCYSLLFFLWYVWNRRKSLFLRTFVSFYYSAIIGCKQLSISAIIETVISRKIFFQELGTLVRNWYVLLSTICWMAHISTVRRFRSFLNHKTAFNRAKHTKRQYSPADADGFEGLPDVGSFPLIDIFHQGN